MTPKPRYQYVLSLPERAVRSLGALSGGLMREIGNVALPASVRRTVLYRTMVDVGLQFLIEDVGQVEQIYPPDGRLAENFLLKRAASHGIELAGILAFRASPIWILAALAALATASPPLPALPQAGQPPASPLPRPAPTAAVRAGPSSNSGAPPGPPPGRAWSRGWTVCPAPPPRPGPLSRKDACR